MKKIRLSLVALAFGALLSLTAVAPAFADSTAPTPLSSIIPGLDNKFNFEIDGVIVGGIHSPVGIAFLGWYAAHPAQVIAFLQFLHDHPAVAQYFFAWSRAHPDKAAALYNALAAAPAVPAVQT